MSDTDVTASREREAYDAGRLAGFEDGLAAAQLDVGRLTRAVMVAVGSPHPDDFGIAYRQSRGFSPAGLAEAIAAEYVGTPT